MKVECKECDAVVRGIHVAHYEYCTEQYGPTIRHSFLKCPACSAPLLVVQEEVDQDEWDEPLRLYPPDAPGVDASWPASVRDSYIEARKCLRVNALHATAVMCRRTLEEVCLEHKISEKTLVRSLEKMKAEGYVDEKLLEWAQELRVVGNLGAHGGGNNVHLQDAKDAVEFTKALIDYVFTFRAKFLAFKARRGAPATSVSPATSDMESE